MIATFTEHKEPECLTLQWTLRNFKPVSSVVVQKETNGVLFERRSDLHPEDLKQAGHDKKFTTRHLLNVLPEDGLTGDAWFKAVNEETGMSQKTYENLRKKLKDADKVYFSKLENVWAKTSKCVEEDSESDEDFVDGSDSD